MVANALIIAATILLYVGLEHFVDKPNSHVRHYLLLAAFSAVHAYFTLVQPNVAARIINFSVGLLVISFQGVWLVQRRAEPMVISTHGNLMALILQVFNPSVDFMFWKSMSMPDVFQLTTNQPGRGLIRRLWQ